MEERHSTAVSGGIHGSLPMAESDRPDVALPAWLFELADREYRGTSMAYLAKHSHSFRYAARFLPVPFDTKVADVYAFCRFTDDMVDRAETGDKALLESRLLQWKNLARHAYEGESVGLPLVERPMREMARAGIPFRYAADLIEGVRMDLHPCRFATLAELEVYTYRVAGVVGLWLTEMVGQSNPEILKFAADLGHAMQLTNILRDVGEDMRSGRCYLPLSTLATHGLSVADVAEAAHGQGPMPKAWPPFMEEMMALAEARYRNACRGMVDLPGFFQRPVMTAALVYRDIHRSLRKNGYDNFRLRAYSSKGRKLWLGLQARWKLKRLRKILESGSAR